METEGILARVLVGCGQSRVLETWVGSCHSTYHGWHFLSGTSGWPWRDWADLECGSVREAEPEAADSVRVSISSILYLVRSGHVAGIDWVSGHQWNEIKWTDWVQRKNHRVREGFVPCFICSKLLYYFYLGEMIYMMTMLVSCLYFYFIFRQCKESYWLSLLKQEESLYNYTCNNSFHHYPKSWYNLL